MILHGAVFFWCVHTGSFCLPALDHIPDPVTGAGGIVSQRAGLEPHAHPARITVVREPGMNWVHRWRGWLPKEDGILYSKEGLWVLGSPRAHTCLRAQQWRLMTREAPSQGADCPLHLERYDKVRGVSWAPTEDSSPLLCLAHMWTPAGNKVPSDA